MGSLKEDIKDTWLGLYESAQDRWNNFIQFLQEAWVLLLLLFAALLIVWWLADPPPPKHVLMATGEVGGSYEVLGKKYADYFAKKGITLELVPSRGSQENIARLSDRQDPVQATFVQAGVINPAGIKGIVSLGSVAYEPIWFFNRGPQINETDFSELGSRFKKILSMKISIGANGSGTHSQAIQLLRVAGYDQYLPDLLSLPTGEGVDALISGKLDGIFVVDEIDSPNVQKLLSDPNLHLVGFKRAEAFTRLLPYLEILPVPEASFSLVRDFPSQDIQLLSTTTRLLVDDRMHPAIQYLFLEAAQAINGKQSFFAQRGEFPSFKNSGFPESEVALRFEKKGVPPLMNYLPFWVAEFVARMFFLLLPFLAFAYPIFSSLPSYRTKRIRVRINKMYGALWAFEQELAQEFNLAQREAYLQKINQMEADALKLKVPKSMASDYYALRSSMDYVRNCLSRGEQPYQASAEPGVSPQTDQAI